MGLYVKVITQFEKFLFVVGLDERKYGKQRRRKITLHSFQRFVKTVISDQKKIQTILNRFLVITKALIIQKKNLKEEKSMLANV